MTINEIYLNNIPTKHYSTLSANLLALKQKKDSDRIELLLCKHERTNLLGHSTEFILYYDAYLLPKR